MDRKVIGTRAKRPVVKIILLLIGGLAFIAGGLLINLFVIQGIIGNSIMYGAAGGGIVPIGAAFKMIVTRRNIVFIDSTYLYLESRAIPLADILYVQAKGKKLIVTSQSSKHPIHQELVKNCEKVAQHIRDAVQEFARQKRLAATVAHTTNEMQAPLFEDSTLSKDIPLVVIPEGLEAAKEMFFAVEGKTFELATTYGTEYWKHKVPREVEEEWRKELEQKN